VRGRREDDSRRDFRGSLARQPAPAGLAHRRAIRSTSLRVLLAVAADVAMLAVADQVTSSQGLPSSRISSSSSGVGSSE